MDNRDAFHLRNNHGSGPFYIYGGGELLHCDEAMSCGQLDAMI
jgi:hypothetical protein